MADAQDFCKVCFHDRKVHVNEEGACLSTNCDCEIYRHGETRVTSSTGASKGTKEARYDLIPIPALDALARLYGKGAVKYAEHNWRLGYEWSKSYAAAQRHMAAFWSGEDIDPETQIPHVICASFHMFALATYLTEHPEFDDRFETNQGAPPKSLEEVMAAAFSDMGAVPFFAPPEAPQFVIPMAEGNAEDLDIIQKADEDPIETAAQWLSMLPEGKTVSFTDDFTDEDIQKVFARAEEIKKSDE